MSPAPEQQKETVYLDVDDEITAIIDRVKSSSNKIIALVLPKRATVLHSIVNMKLLKRAADEAKKHIVLITSETGVLPLAGAVGVHVAKTLQSKPMVPQVPTAEEPPLEVSETDSDVELDTSKPVGALAGLPIDGDEETIEVDNSDKPLITDKTKPAKNKKLKIPNFDKFRTRLFLGIGILLLLIIGWVFAAMVLPKAVITIKTNTSAIASKLNMTASMTAKELAKEGNIVPAMNREFKKADAIKIPTTGEKNNGTKAGGKATLTLSDCSQDQVTVPAGTLLSSTNLNFVTQADVLLKSVKIGNQCRNADFPDFSTATVNVSAQNAGDQYNLSARTYTVTGFSNVSANGTVMTGGTSKIIKIVAQSDIDNAKQKILDQNQQAAKNELQQQLGSTGYIALSDTFTPGNPIVTATPNVGEEASEVNVNVSTAYTMVGAKQDAVKQLIEDDIKQHIDASKQEILDNGIGAASFQILEKLPAGDVKFSIAVEATAGVQQDAAAIKQAVAGKKRRDTQTFIEQRPGVQDVNIRYSPFWVVSTPKKQSKIIVKFE